MSDYNYFIIYTEHQLVQVNEAIDYYRLSNQKNILFVFRSHTLESGSNAWLDELQSTNKFNKVYTFYQWSFLSLLKSHRKELAKFKKTLDFFAKKNNMRFFTSIYATDTSQLAFTILKPKTYYLMDDGYGSFTVLLKRRKSNNKHFSLAIFSIIHKKNIIKLPHSITFFTKYNLPVNEPDKIEVYSIEKIENKIIFDYDSVILLGSVIYKSFPKKKSIIESNYYFETLKTILQKYKGKIIYYYPHRYEDKASINKIKLLGFAVVEHQKSFEKVFTELNPCPHVLISFASPILDNLSKKYKNLPKLIMIKLNLDRYRRAKEDFKLVYKDIQTNSLIKIMEL